MNATTYRRAPGPLPELPTNDVRQLSPEDDAELAALMERAWGNDGGAAQINWWRLYGVPDASFVAVADRVVAASLAS